jgi:hypothetical protein
LGDFFGVGNLTPRRNGAKGCAVEVEVHVGVVEGKGFLDFFVKEKWVIWRRKE